MQSTTIRFPVVNFKRLQTDSDDEHGRIYLMIANITDIAHKFDEWREASLRDLDVTSAPASAIRQTLIDEPAEFRYRNRGLTLLAQGVTYDNVKKAVAIDFSNSSIHGLIDGGHTYQILSSYVDELSDDNQKSYVAYVCLEVLEGINEPDFVRKIVDARNTALPVTDQSLDGLTGRLDIIENVLSGQLYEDNIYYQQGDEQSWNAEPKNIDIRDIISYLICFDAAGFTNDAHPIIAYSSKQKAVEYYAKRYEEDAIQKYLPLLPDILELRDGIYKELPEFYEQSGGRFRDLKGVVFLAGEEGRKTVRLDFIQQESSYIIPSAYIYPILAAFRQLVHVESDGARWIYEPRRFFREIGIQLAKRLSEHAQELRNSNELGKKSAFWQACLAEVKVHFLEKKAQG